MAMNAKNKEMMNNGFLLGFFGGENDDELEHPGAKELLERNGFSVSRSSVPKSRNPADIRTEQTINRHAKYHGNYSANYRWGTTRHCRAQYVEAALQITDMVSEDCSVHKELEPSQLQDTLKWAWTGEFLTLTVGVDLKDQYPMARGPTDQHERPGLRVCGNIQGGNMVVHLRGPGVMDIRGGLGRNLSGGFGKIFFTYMTSRGWGKSVPDCGHFSQPKNSGSSPQHLQLTPQPLNSLKRDRQQWRPIFTKFKWILPEMEESAKTNILTIFHEDWMKTINILTKFHKDWMKTAIYCLQKAHTRTPDITRSHKLTMSLCDSDDFLKKECKPQIIKYPQNFKLHKKNTSNDWKEDAQNENSVGDKSTIK
ncbi:hypothetical protein DPMN_104923 [Dreissena polymorpha]|uniref:Uncharacterized protein n=1 Tax=Dreissena polymorpha TaxID=45954 RepID=A0A9D4HAM6_DREPO|nr:hypothetical protein DPMN_104923 [Dreissena polymorpha]